MCSVTHRFEKLLIAASGSCYACSLICLHFRRRMERRLQELNRTIRLRSLLSQLLLRLFGLLLSLECTCDFHSPSACGFSVSQEPADDSGEGWQIAGPVTDMVEFLHSGRWLYCLEVCVALKSSSSMTCEGEGIKVQ